MIKDEGIVLIKRQNCRTLRSEVALIMIAADSDAIINSCSKDSGDIINSCSDNRVDIIPLRLFVFDFLQEKK